VVDFGPPILMATETFESYNAIIRTWSINSNRGAPSRDIALAWALWHRIRHLLSGGLVAASGSEVIRSWDPSQGILELVHAGDAVNSLISHSSSRIIRRKLGFRASTEDLPGE